MTRNRAQKRTIRAAAEAAGTNYTTQLRKTQPRSAETTDSGHYPDLSHIPAAPGTPRVFDDEVALELADAYLTDTTIPIGVNQLTGEVVLWDLEQYQHVKVEGVSGAGESTLMDQISRIISAGGRDKLCVWFPGQDPSADEKMIEDIGRAFRDEVDVLGEEHLVIVLDSDSVKTMAGRYFDRALNAFTRSAFDAWVTDNSKVHLLRTRVRQFGPLPGDELDYRVGEEALIGLSPSSNWTWWIPAWTQGIGAFHRGGERIPLSAWQAQPGSVPAAVSVAARSEDLPDHRKFPREFPLDEASKAEGVFLGMHSSTDHLVARNRNKFAVYISNDEAREAVAHAFAASALARGETVVVISELGRAEVHSLTRIGARRITTTQLPDLVALLDARNATVESTEKDMGYVANVAGKLPASAAEKMSDLSGDFEDIAERLSALVSVSMIYLPSDPAYADNDPAILDFIDRYSGPFMNVMSILTGQAISDTAWELLEDAAVLYDDASVRGRTKEGFNSTSSFLGTLAEVLIDNSGGSADIDGDTLTRGFRRGLGKTTSSTYAMARVWAGFAHEGDAVVTEFSPYRCGQSIARSASKRRYESEALMDAWAERVQDFVEGNME